MLLKFPSWKWSINHAVADCKVLIIRWNAWHRENVTTGQGFLLFENESNISEWTVRQLHKFFVFVFFHFFFLTPKSLLFFCTVSWSQFIWPLSCSPRHEYTLSLYSSPKWWKSILTRDQDLYDKQSLQLEAHQAHLNGRQKQKISAPCAFCWNPIENLLMPSPICATVLLLMLFFGGGGEGGSTGGCARLEGCAGREWCRSPG